MLKNTWQTAMAYTGAILGAGFASGQELWQFFGLFGFWGLLAMVGVALGFGFFGYLIIFLCQKYGLTTQQEFLNWVLPTPINKIMDFVVSWFMLGILAIMLSGAGSLGWELLGLPKIFGIAFLWFCLYFALEFPLNGFLKLQNWLISPLIVLILALAFLGISKIEPNFFALEVETAWLNRADFLPCVKIALVYLGYNLLSGFSVLVAIGNKAVPKGAVLGGGILGLLGGLLLTVLIFNVAEGVIPLGSQLPLLSLAFSFGKLWLFFYGLIMLAAIFTTAITSAFVLVKRLRFVPPRVGRILVLSLAFPLSLFDFSFLVSKVYGLFGVLGLILLVGIISAGLRHKQA